MKVVALLAFFVPSVVANVFERVTAIHAGERILSTSVFGSPTTYQSLARDATAANLSDSASDLTIRNYYGLACIYFATNGVGNVKTASIIPGAPIPNWLTDDWLTGDYCNWHGITCDGSKNVISIDLNTNQLYGTWPDEIVLLKSSLRYVDLYNNFFLYSLDPAWMGEMGQLEYLFFGTTSFESNGVSDYLAGCKKLRKLNRALTP
jgi:hypothetical protein